MNGQTETESTEAPPTDRLIDLPEASRLTALAPATLRHVERRGLLPGYRLLGRLRFRLSDVVAFIEAARLAPRKLPPPELLLHRERRTSRRRR